ncbi:MAG: hypothetical protein ACI9GB_002399, partial [Halioglobus sp.]
HFGPSQSLYHPIFFDIVMVNHARWLFLSVFLSRFPW